MSYTFVYLIYALMFCALWGVLFVLRPDLRRRMFLFSLCALPLGPVSEIWYLRDYWQRPTVTGLSVSVEDFLFAFALGGITYALYKVVDRKQVGASGHPRRMWLLGAFALTIVLALVVGTDMFGFNSVLVSIVVFLSFAVVMWSFRPDLMYGSLATGVLILALFFLIYQTLEAIFPGVLVSFCTSCNPSGVRLFGINIEELGWDFAWGLVGGIVLETVRGHAFTQA
jgi:uncharacterized membrane protein YvlD (DUF360 family)